MYGRSTDVIHWSCSVPTFPSNRIYSYCTQTRHTQLYAHQDEGTNRTHCIYRPADPRVAFRAANPGRAADPHRRVEEQGQVVPFPSRGLLQTQESCGMTVLERRGNKSPLRILPRGAAGTVTDKTLVGQAQQCGGSTTSFEPGIFYLF